MKKLLVLVTVMVAVFGFSAGAFAAWGDLICTNCKSCIVGNIPCDLPGEQDTDDCGPFDYDDFNPATGRDGYCLVDEVLDPNCRAIFNICNCENPSVFDSGETIGVRMTVLVDGVAGQLGAYWAEDASTLDLRTFNSVLSEDPCDDAGKLESFGLIDFFQSNMTTGATPLGGKSCDTIDPVNQAVVLASKTGQGFLIDATDVTEKRHAWWIDILPIKIDRNVLNDGERISVKIELMNKESGGICADCDAVCECTIDVANVCCQNLLPQKFGMYFPYVTWVGPWATGIVVTNISNMLPVEFGMDVPAADMEVTLLLHDVNGDVYSFFKDDFTTTSWAFNLAVLLPEFSGVPAVGAAWLEVQTNFIVDGHLYMQNGVFGLGTLPRQGSSLIEIYKYYSDMFGINVADLL